MHASDDSSCSCHREAMANASEGNALTHSSRPLTAAGLSSANLAPVTAWQGEVPSMPPLDHSRVQVCVKPWKAAGERPLVTAEVRPMQALFVNAATCAAVTLFHMVGDCMWFMHEPVHSRRATQSNTQARMW